MQNRIFSHLFGDLARDFGQPVMLWQVGVLLAGWGYFIRCNRDAEELEPEAMAEAKREDHKLDKPSRKRTV